MADNVENIGKVFVVDPNPVNNEVVPAEDMFIYVKFSAYPKSRVTYNGDGTSLFGVEGEVNFISTKIKYDSNGELNPKEQDTYATTDWTEIGSFKNADTVSSGVLEGFGIKSISIKYDASLVPRIDITFTDVRGGALFDVISDNDILSPYAVFFKMPYPTFNLSVKGYFGQSVSYCLHMMNWTSNFDGKTGNFDITANFLGFQQAFLSDMVIGNIIGVVNTEEGANKLNEIFNTSTNPEISDEVRKLDDFFVKIANLNLDSERLKLDSDNFRLLKFLNGKIKLLEEIQTFVGFPIQKEPNKQSKEDGTQKDYLKIKNDPTQISTDTIKDSVLEERKNYLSIRDYLLINIVNLSDYKTYINSLNDVVKVYNDYINSVDTKDAKNSLENLKNQSNDKNKNSNKGSIDKVLNYIEPKSEDKEFIKLFSLNNDANDWEKYIINSQKGRITDNNFILKNVLEEMSVEKSSLGIYLKDNYENDTSGVNLEFDINSFKTVLDNGSLYNQTMLKETKVLVVDFREIRAILAKQINDLKDVIKSQKEIVQREINDELFDNFKKNNNFIPNIQNCFEIIANNTQAMVETVYKITEKSEKINSGNRRSILRRNETDIPDSLLKNESGNSVAWPTIYRTNDSDKSKIEVYLGEINGVTKQDFPEYDFVERVYENFVKRKQRLDEITRSSVGGLDSDNWFPINPIDYEENPFLIFRGYNDNTTVKESFIETTLERVGILLNYSRFDDATGYQNLSNYGKFDALNAYEVLKTNNVKLLMMKEILNNITSSSFFTNDYITKSNYYTKNIEVTSPGVTVQFKNNFKFGSYEIGKDYALFDVNGIINNSQKLIDSVIQTTEYKDITKNVDGSKTYKIENAGNLYYSKSYINNNLTTNNILNVWNIDVCRNLFKSNGEKIDTLNGSQLADINPNGGTNDTGIYLNKTQFIPNNQSTSYEDMLIGSTTATTNNFYSQQNRYGKGLLLLSTFPFRDFKEGFLDSVFPGTENRFSGARIVKLPSLYVYFLGGLLWRSTQNVDPLIWDNYELFQTPKDKYLTKMSYYGYNSAPNKSTISNKDIEPNLLNLPESVKNQFIQRFKTWVNTNISNNQTLNGFENSILLYSTNTGTPEGKKAAETEILKEVKKISNFIILNPEIFDNPQDLKLKLTQTSYSEYINTFKNTFNKLVTDDNTGNNDSEKEKKPKKENNEIKLQIYNYFKNINNKWVSSDPKGKGFSVCGENNSSKNLIDYFKFIDRGWRDIGKDITINLKTFLSVGNDYNTSVYFFMDKILRDNNFLFQVLPTYINYKDATEVSKIFKPQTNIDNNNSTGPLFCGIYVGGVSEYLDIKERNNYYFNNDGFAFKNGEIPSDFIDGKEVIPTSPNAEEVAKSSDDFSLVAFRVAFGAQNQTIFTDVSLSQQEHKETAEYFAAQEDLISRRGATQPAYIGTNLLRLFKTRSYTCSVNALGCMNIQPLMYFDLQNVPFFNGAYLITSVDHQISPNHMTTSFKGLRQSKFQTKPTIDIVSSLDIDLNETDTTPPLIFTNLSNTNGLFSIGLRNEIAEQPFDYSQITQSNLELIGVPTSVIQSLGSNPQQFFEGPMKSGNQPLVSNSQVTMFLANVLANSNYLQNNSLNFSDGNYQNGEEKFPDSNP